MEDAPREYTVVGVRRLAANPGEPEEQAPAEILERFEGRAFDLHDLEQRGVRIVGGRAVFTFGGQDWRLDLFPEVA